VSRVRTLSDLEPGELEGRGVLVRVDYNVPIDEAGAVGDATRVDVTLPSLTFLRDSGARVVLVSHLGRPGGTRDPSASLAPVAQLLSARLEAPVPLIEGDPRGTEVAEAVRAIPRGGIGLLENIRYDPGETKNDSQLAEALALIADGFVSDAFGVAHRAHASNVGAARMIRGKGGFAVAGFLMARELHFLSEALKDPARPFVAVMGGAKISGKLELIRAILKRVDRLLVGGAMANTFFRALGLETGLSLVEDDLVPMARELLEEAGDRLLLPVDCLVASELEPTARPRVVDRTDIGDGDRVGDIGPGSQALFGRELSGTETVVWNGPMGVFELEPFSAGTFFLAQTLAGLADEGAMVVLGGGDSAAAAHAAGVSERMTHVSTGGGASLDLLAGNELPGVSVLQMESD
jgi:phosphoglycerate kinase